MLKKLNISPLVQYNILSVKGEEPLRNYKRTLGVIASRMGDRYVDFLAEPRIVKGGKEVEWYTTIFTNTPRPLSTLEGEEREQYTRELGRVMNAYSSSLPDPEDDAYPLMTKLVIVPDENSIYCADGKVVITGWGLKPRSAMANTLNLLQYSGKAKPLFPEKKEITPQAVEPVVPEKDTLDLNREREAREQQERERRAEEERLRRAEEEERLRLEQLAKLQALQEENERLRHEQESKKTKKRSWLKWLLLVLGILITAGIIFFIFRACSGVKAETVESMEKRAPALTSDKVVLDKDSVGYIVSDRLGILIKEGGDINAFCQEFRKHYTDTDKYKLVQPDTLLNRVMLLCPADERETLKKEIKEKMPTFKLLITNESVSVRNGLTSDPAMNNAGDRYYFDMVNAIDAWDIEKGSKDVVVAILDGDIDISHPELKDKVVSPYDVVSGTSNMPRVPSCGGHGTHTAGTAVGIADNNMGACGIAPGCTLMPINVFEQAGYSTTSEQIEGVEYAIANGADIISMSIGSSINPAIGQLSLQEQKQLADTMDPDDAELWDAVCQYAEEQGVLIIRAAGNENVYAGLNPKTRSEHQLIVSAVDQNGERSIWDPFFQSAGSNYGEMCRISAPGTDVLNAIPDGGFDYMDGTSMATPIVAGGAALLKSHNPSLTPVQIREILVATANPQPGDNIGPIMDLVAALNADPDNLPRQPLNNRKLPTPVNPTPGQGTNPLQWLFQNFGQQPSPTPITNPQIRPTPQLRYGMRPTLPFPVQQQDCDMIYQQYAALEQMRYMIDMYMEQLRKECPECL